MLARLATRDFRNLAPAAWEPGTGRHLLLGGNGAGKTSHLEAIYAVATTKSFRTPRLAECARHGADGFRLEAEVAAVARTRLELAWGPEGRRRAVNGATGTLAEHLTALPVVAWTGADVETLAGAPALRRRLLDRGAIGLSGAALDDLGRYRRALAAKRELLASGGPGDPAALAAWNGVLAPAAAAVARRRADYALRLGAALAEVLAEIGLGLPPIALAYRPSPAAAGGAEDEQDAGSGAAVVAIAEALERAAPAERRRGLPLVGPHRDDLAIEWGGHAVGRVASAGEAKLLSLALVAAHGRVLEAAGRRPVYLLDDADAELAPDTLAAAWRAFAPAEQLFATSNRPAVWSELPVETRWRVAAGRLGKG